MSRAIPLAVRLAPLAWLSGCGGHPHVEPAPAGLTYNCNGDPLTIVYGDGGYIPDARVRNGNGMVARSRAHLVFRGQQVDLVAEDAFTDLRYVRVTDDSRIVWTAQGEAAQLEWPGESGASPSPLACERVRTVTPAAPAGAEAPHPAA